jgi:protein-disulfide isomerase
LVLKLIEEAKAEIPNLRLEEVDITERPEMAVKYRVLATPAIAINGRIEFVGAPKEEALRARLRAALPGFGES